MKCTVQYYDVDTDTCITRECLDFEYLTSNNEFSFTPLNGLIRKAITISRPSVTVTYNRDRRQPLHINVEGYQYMKSGGYWMTKTKLNFEEYDDSGHS